ARAALAARESRSHGAGRLATDCGRRRMIALLKLYPREWRERYGRELEEIVAAQPRSLRLAVDLLAGAIDAHLKPQLTTGRRTGAPTPEGGEPMLDRLRHGDTAALSKRESLISAALT